MEKLASLELLIDYLKRLPSVGTKSAERMAYAILNMDSEVVEGFAESLVRTKASVHNCPVCGLFTEKELCAICSDKTRNSDTVIVVSILRMSQALIRLMTLTDAIMSLVAS